MREELGLTHSLPEWLIDDTANIGEARVFIVHTITPRFIGEVLPEHEADILGGGVELQSGRGEVVCRIQWIDVARSVEELEDLIASLQAALERHWSIRERRSG